jgi:hypothetical protein
MKRKKKKSCLSWYDKLTVRDRRYVDNVVKELRKHPDVSPRSVAVGLIEELGIGVHVTNVANKLKDLTRNG